jgi:Spy/CpxP family protein refolding chaperone
MKKMLITVAGVGALAATMMFAQNVAPRGHARFGQRMAQVLNLTPDQQATAKQVMMQAREQAAPLRQQLKQSREALANAVKSGNDAQIDQIAKDQAPLMAQVAAIRAHAFEKIYATLTPEQKTKADNMRQHFMTHRGQRQHKANG